MTPSPTATPTATPTETPAPTPTPWQVVFDFVGDREDWTSVTVPLVFGEPQFAWQPDSLKIISLSNVNTFGYWKSPEDAVPVAAGYLYRARFTVSTDITDQSRVPQIRLRANSSNLQQSDYLGVDSTGDGGASPVPSGTDYDLYFVPPADDTFSMLAFDLLNFTADDAANAEVSLESVIVNRFALDSLTTPTIVALYTFDTSTEGWTTGGAPAIFTPPTYNHGAGELELHSASNTNTFGYWQNNGADIVVASDRLYRGVFAIRTDVTDRSRVPELRLRFNTANLQASQTLGIDSTGDGASSPGTTSTPYDGLYFQPPANCVGEGLIVSFDLLNFDTGDAAQASFFLDSATIEALLPPPAP
jgi:hypothetical protein